MQTMRKRISKMSDEFIVLEFVNDDLILFKLFYIR